MIKKETKTQKETKTLQKRQSFDFSGDNLTQQQASQRSHENYMEMDLEAGEYVVSPILHLAADYEINIIVYSNKSITLPKTNDDS